MIEKKLNVTEILYTNLFYKTARYDGTKKEMIYKCHLYKEPNYLLIIAGCSGSGKSTFEENLIKSHSTHFNKLPQVTTRVKRDNTDNGYYFISNEIYDFMKDSLIARLESFNGKQYGTLPVFAKNKINTVIASYDAIEDLFNFINDHNDLAIIPMLLLFDIDIKNITTNGVRKDRDTNFLEKERKELMNMYEKYKNQCIYSGIYKYEDNNRFAKLEDIIEF